MNQPGNSWNSSAISKTRLVRCHCARRYEKARWAYMDRFAVQLIARGPTWVATPKPVRLIRFILELAAVDRDAIVLDFFAGSGSTADAVMQQNASDGGSRRLHPRATPRTVRA